MDYYNTLGVDKQASQADIKKAYRRLASKHHPDRGGDEASFKKVQEAYDVLGNEKAKAEYDNPVQGSSFGGGFDSFFHDMFRQAHAQHRTRARANRDAVCDLSVNLREAYTGIDKIIDLGYSKIKFSVPAGTSHGTQFHLTGKGPLEHSNLPPGDLVVRIHVINPPEWDRRGDDLYCKVGIDYFQSMLGCTVEIEHINGTKVRVKVPKRSGQDGRLRLSNLGMPNSNSGVKGTLYVILDVSMPSLMDDQLDKLEQFINKEI
jgi:DnaJ-class molecular chaperone